MSFSKERGKKIKIKQIQINKAKELEIESGTKNVHLILYMVQVK